MSDRKLSQMLPTSRVNPERTRMRNHAAQTNDAFADAMVANFPQGAGAKRDGLVRILVEQGMPFETAMMQADEMLAGSQMLPTKPADLGRFGQGGDDEVVHTNPAERAALKRMGGAGTRNPVTGLLEFRPIGDSGRTQGFSNSKDHSARGGGAKGSAPPATKQQLYKNEYGLETEYGAPVHTSELGIQSALPEMATPGKPAQSWSSWKDQVANYNKAAMSWNDETVQNNILGWALPFGMQNVAPRIDQPATYTGGTYHFGANPAAALGSVGEMILGPAGMALGPAMGKAYDLFGGKNLVFSGPDVPADWDKKGGVPPNQSASQGSTSPTGAPGPSGGNTGNGGNGNLNLLPPINGGEGGSMLPPITAPQPASPLAPSPGMSPGGYMPIGGPSAYGWRRPAWQY